MDTPTISLVIPAYNEEKYLPECLAHVQKNSNGLLSEIIVVDNASTDKTREVAESFPGVRVVREDKKGLTRARQCGYEHARGDILAYIDADTHMPQKWCEQIVEEFKDPTLSCLSGPYVYYDLPQWRQVLVSVYWYSALPLYWAIGYMVTGGNFAIRRSTLDRMRGFDTNIEFYGEDTNIARRAHEVGKVKFSQKFVIATSARRLIKQGFFSTGTRYVQNFLSEALFKRPATNSYTDIR